MPIVPLLRLIRPSHWVKNLVVLLPVIFAMRMDQPWAWAQAGIAAAAFCLAASGVYAFNDIIDRRRDLAHPTKKHRPIASGQVSVTTAMCVAIALTVAGIVVAAMQSLNIVAVLAAYIALQGVYTLFLKNRILLDVIAIAFGFVLRAGAGAVAISVEVSPWLFVCMFTLCLFMGFCKRGSELGMIGDAQSPDNHRQTLAGYTPQLLTHLITLSAAIAVVSFLQYATSDRTVAHLGSDHLVYTLPLVVYGVFRFAMLSLKGTYTDPVELLVRDWPTQATILLWVLAAMVITAHGHGWMRV